MRIAHIAPHIGGGVGAVLKDFINLSSALRVHNHLFCLDKCDTNFHDLAINGAKIESLAYQFNPSFPCLLNESDVILIHYWNHPLLAKFLATFNFPPCRLLFWCHNSGLQEPHIIPTYLARMARQIIFTNRCSIYAPNLQLSIQREPEKFNSVHSTQALDSFHKIGQSRTYQEPFTKLLYVGTVSKAKMHADSAKIFASLSLQGFKIYVVGGPDHLSLQNETELLGGKIKAIGQTQSVLKFYRDADIFIYPMRHDHYGTGEQVLLEAMAAGLPAVAFNNSTESEIIEQRVTGEMVNSFDEFVNITQKICSDTKLYKQMSAKSMERASVEFDANIMTKRLIDHFLVSLDFEKATPRLPFNNQSNPVSDLEVLALNSFFDENVAFEIHRNNLEGTKIAFNKIRSLLCNLDNVPIWTAKTKSTPFHYLSYFTSSNDLRDLTEMIKKEILLKKCINS